MWNPQVHERFLTILLKEIFSDIFLASRLKFIGGTACYFFYELDRFSTDLDFELSTPEDSQAIYEKISLILQKHGRLVDQQIKRNTIFFCLDYDTDSKNIKIEISTRRYPAKYTLKNLFGLSLPVMDIDDMFAYKLVAIKGRKKLANRDLYDANWFFQKNISPDEKIVEELTGQNFIEYLKDLQEFIEKNINNRNILNGLGEVLDMRQKDWVKKNLKNDLIFHLKSYMHSKEKNQGGINK